MTLPPPRSQDPPTRESGPLNQGVRIPPPGSQDPPPGSQDPSTRDSWNPSSQSQDTPPHSGESGPFTQDSQDPSTWAPFPRGGVMGILPHTHIHGGFERQRWPSRPWVLIRGPEGLVL